MNARTMPVALTMIRWPISYQSNRAWSFQHWTIDPTRTLCGVPIPRTTPPPQIDTAIPAPAPVCEKCARMAAAVAQHRQALKKAIDPALAINPWITRVK